MAMKRSARLGALAAAALGSGGGNPGPINARAEKPLVPPTSKPITDRSALRGAQPKPMTKPVTAQNQLSSGRIQHQLDRIDNVKPAMPEDISDVVAGLGNQPITTPSQEVVKSPHEIQNQFSDDKALLKRPTMSTFMVDQARKAGEPQFTETMSPQAIANVGAVNVVSNKFRNIGDMQPQDRAATGARAGAVVGAGASGPIGSVIGAGVGSLVSRGIGMVKSGEKIDLENRNKAIEGLRLSEVMGQDGSVSFADGGKFSISNDPSYRLQNISSMLGKPDRSIYETDETNPLTQLGAQMSRPLARMYAQGVLGMTPDDDPRHLATTDQLTGLFANMLTQDINNAGGVRSRAQELANKFGFTGTGSRMFFNRNKTRIPKEEALTIRKGLDILYGAADAT